MIIRTEDRQILVYDDVKETLILFNNSKQLVKKLRIDELAEFYYKKILLTDVYRVWIRVVGYEVLRTARYRLEFHLTTKDLKALTYILFKEKNEHIKGLF